VEITPTQLPAGFDNVLRQAEQFGRDPQSIKLTCCLAIELTQQPVPQDQRFVRGSSEQVVEALRAYRDIGVEHVALQFTSPRWPDRMEQNERFASEVMPHVQ